MALRALSRLRQPALNVLASAAAAAEGWRGALPAAPHLHAGSSAFVDPWGQPLLHRCWSPQSAAYGAAARQLHQDGESYRVSVVTGNLRGAGTRAGAYVQLIGSKASSDLIEVGNSTEDGLARASTTTFDVNVPFELGSLRRVYVERAKASSTETGDGWYLEQVNVVGPQNEVLIFPCNAWFGHSDCGDYSGALERNLIPLTPDADRSQQIVQGDAVKVHASGVAFPHPEKVLKSNIRGVNTRHFGYGGEDAYFYAQGKDGIFGMGVADGVYAWKERGIDSGTFSRTLMETALHMVQAGSEDVVQIMHVCARHVESEGVQGSCTACLLTVNTQLGRLQAASLGDSGFFLIGKEQGRMQPTIRFRTSQLEHEFGRPYQLGHHQYANQPDDAELATIPVFRGDVVVMGTDGLLDNVSEMEILDQVVKMQAQGLKPHRMAQVLAKMAFDASIDKHRVTPYSRSATEAFDMVYSGGKQDDITVLVACME